MNVEERLLLHHYLHALLHAIPNADLVLVAEELGVASVDPSSTLATWIVDRLQDDSSALARLPEAIRRVLAFTLLGLPQSLRDRIQSTLVGVPLPRVERPRYWVDGLVQDRGTIIGMQAYTLTGTNQRNYIGIAQIDALGYPISLRVEGTQVDIPIPPYASVEMMGEGAITYIRSHDINLTVGEDLSILDPQNPYEYIATVYLRMMAQERHIVLPPFATRQDMIIRLTQFDRINPYYLRRGQHPDQLNAMEIALYAGLHHIDLRTINPENSRLLSLISYAMRLPLLEPRTMAPRIPRLWLDGPITDLRRALSLAVNGYRIPPEQLHLEVIEPEETALLIMDLSYYPPVVGLEELVEIMTIYNSLGHYIDLSYMARTRTDDNLVIQMMTSRELFFILTHGVYPPGFTVTEEQRRRWARLQQAPLDIQHLCQHLVHARTVGAVVNTYSPLEVYALAIDVDLENVISTLGILPPPEVERREYVIGNLDAYYDVVMRPVGLSYLNVPISEAPRSLLSQLSDVELRDYIQASVFYESRDDLIDEIVRRQQEPGFFIPQSPSGCRNETTMLFSPVREVGLSLVAYGTLTDYRCYEIEELLLAFGEREEGHPETFTFRRPEGGTFSVDDVEVLIQLLRQYNGSPDLINRIEEGLAWVQNLDQDQQQQVAYVEQQPEEHRRIIRSFLYHLFYAGMYMRRWTGNADLEGRPALNCPYPLTLQSTNVEVDPFIRTTMALNQIHDLLEGVPEELRIFLRSLDEIGALIDEIVVGDHCIRVGSNRFILTSYRYLHLFFHESIPDFDLRDLNRLEE